MRDLLTVLDIERVTVVGHCLGGAVAMQFAYQFPEMVERLVLVSSSGITKDVHILLRMVSLPAVNAWMRVVRLPGGRTAVRLTGNVLEQLGGVTLRPAALLNQTPDIVRMIGDLPDHTAFLAFLKTLRAVVDWRGQVITLLDRGYLAERVPVQIIWGAKDSIFPVSHARLAHSAMPGSRLDVFPDGGHYPFLDDPNHFLDVVDDFLDHTKPAEFDPARWRDVLIAGVSDRAIAGGPATRLAVLDALESGERSAT
jgi:pimeloyl-ACP methyl ester carboxylesterase